ncbi:hypothetical protein EV356DRAFT_568973, partial [Viridothelium virens]
NETFLNLAFHLVYTVGYLNKCIATRLVEDLYRDESSAQRCEAYLEGKVSPFYLCLRTASLCT